MVHAKLSILAEGIAISAPSPRIRVLFDNHNWQEQKTTCYLGFETELEANCLRDWLLEKNTKPYNRHTDAGVCRPRKAKRIPDMPFEVKWHRPDPALLNKLIAKDLSRVAVCA